MSGEKRPKKRPFDAHTMSIWSRNIAIRGSDPKAGLQLLRRRLADGRLPPTTPVYNTALSICGREGWTEECGKLLTEMVARNVRSDERTICSILKSIAIKATMIKDESAIEPLVGEIEGSFTELPGIEAFTLKKKADAIKLALQLYRSWMGFTGGSPSLLPFNGTLNVLAKCRDTNNLQLLLPFRGSCPSKWCPESTLDVITFTTAIMTCGSNFNLGRRYWQRGKEHLKGLLDDEIVSAIAWCLLSELFQSGKAMETNQLNDRRHFVDELLKDASILNQLSATSAGNLMTLAVKLRLFNEGARLWEQKIQPIDKDDNGVNKHSIRAMLLIYEKLGRPEQKAKLEGLLRGNH